MIPEIITVTGGVNFEILPSDLKPDSHIWVSGDYGYMKNGKRGSRVYLKCRCKRICKGRAVVDCAKVPPKLVTLNPHVCGGSVNIPRGHGSQVKKRKRHPEKSFHLNVTTKYEQNT